MMKLPAEIRRSLEECSLPWAIKDGKKHVKITVGGKLAGVLPRTCSEANDRGTRNVAAQIRRIAKEARGAATGSV